MLERLHHGFFLCLSSASLTSRLYSLISTPLTSRLHSLLDFIIHSLVYPFPASLISLRHSSFLLTHVSSSLIFLAHSPFDSTHSLSLISSISLFFPSLFLSFSSLFLSFPLSFPHLSLLYLLTRSLTYLRHVRRPSCCGQARAARVCGCGRDGG